jgi:hypothetical protein
MEDKYNVGGTHYEDKNGNSISEQEYRKKQYPDSPSTGKSSPAEDKEVKKHVG